MQSAPPASMSGTMGSMPSAPIIGPHQFYVRSTAPGDDAVTFDRMIPSDVAARIRRLVNDDRYPEYATPDDFMRDAVVHRLQHLVGDIADPALRAHVERLLNGMVPDERTAH